MEDFLHEHTGGIFQQGRKDQASQKEEKRIFGELRKENCVKHCAKAVDGAQGTVHKSPVYKLSLAKGSIADLNAPAHKGINKIQPDQIAIGICHDNFSCHTSDMIFSSNAILTYIFKKRYKMIKNDLVQRLNRSRANQALADGYISIIYA